MTLREQVAWWNRETAALSVGTPLVRDGDDRDAISRTTAEVSELH